MTKYYYDGLTVVAEMRSTDNGQNWSWKRIMAMGALKVIYSIKGIQMKRMFIVIISMITFITLFAFADAFKGEEENFLVYKIMLALSLSFNVLNGYELGKLKKQLTGEKTVKE